MRLVKAGRIVEDSYVRIVDDSAVPEDGAALIPAARLLADAGELSQRSGATGVLWPNDRSVTELAPYLDRLSLVALAFPNFKDGRAYSQARMLRERHHYRGELRATGQILRDQFVFLQRAGFDSFEVSKPDDAAAFAETIRRYTIFYQPPADGRSPAFRRRIAVVGSATSTPEGLDQEPQADHRIA